MLHRYRSPLLLDIAAIRGSVHSGRQVCSSAFTRSLPAQDMTQSFTNKAGRRKCILGHFRNVLQWGSSLNWTKNCDMLEMIVTDGGFPALEKISDSDRITRIPPFFCRSTFLRAFASSSSSSSPPSPPCHYIARSPLDCRASSATFVSDCLELPVSLTRTPVSL